jgi:hypothetical protein
MFQGRTRRRGRRNGSTFWNFLTFRPLVILLSNGDGFSVVFSGHYYYFFFLL